MIWQEALTTAKEWQESIAALIGFAGVIITLIINAAIQRQHQEAAENEAKKSLRAAITAEFQLLQRSLEGNIPTATANPDDQGSLLVPKEPLRSFVFGVPNTNLGILGPVVAAAVVKARLSYEELHRRYALIATHGESNRHFAIPVTSARLFDGMTENTIEVIKQALKALKVS
jgi:hypothetical protein